MAYKKHFKIANSNGQFSPLGGNRGTGDGDYSGVYNNTNTSLSDVYSGHPNRIDRYNQYEAMDQDSEVNASLDILSEFSTQVTDINNLPFEVQYNERGTDTEVKIIQEQLTAWCSLNDFNKRIFRLFRNTLKYGDSLFIRDPETFKLMYVNPTEVVKVVVNDCRGKEPEQYVIKNIAPNFGELVATELPNQTDWAGSGTAPGASYLDNNQPSAGSGGGSSLDAEEATIDAEHIVHLSLTEGLDANWPFGTSVLENIFKVYKQKELLEDAVIIYRISRAPERRVFYIDTGSMPSHLAMGFVERVKNEIHQRRIPTQNGGGANIADATYNPLSMNEDFFFPQTAEGRGSKVDTLPGGAGLGEIDDLKFFTNKMFRGLRIPSSYLPSGMDDQGASVGDGRVGTAMIQEFRFNEYCKRLQQLIVDKLDQEFKVYLNWRGLNIDSSLFNLTFNKPQNFAAYRQIELDTSRISSFSSMEATPYLSKRFMLKRFLGLTEAELVENDEMWREENGTADAGDVTGTDLRAAGVTPGGIEGDMDNLDIDDIEIDDPELDGDVDIADLDTPDLEGGDEEEVPEP